MFAKLLKEYRGKVDVALIIEPYSLVNIAANRKDANCSNLATLTAYEYGVKYAVETLYLANPEAAIYLDAAHGG